MTSVSPLAAPKFRTSEGYRVSAVGFGLHHLDLGLTILSRLIQVPLWPWQYRVSCDGRLTLLGRFVKFLCGLSRVRIGGDWRRTFFSRLIKLLFSLRRIRSAMTLTF